MLVPDRLPESWQLEQTDRETVEFHQLSEAARAHLYARHREYVQAMSPIAHSVVLWLSSLVVECGDPDALQAARQRWRDYFDEMLAAAAETFTTPAGGVASPGERVMDRLVVLQRLAR